MIPQLPDTLNLASAQAAIDTLAPVANTADTTFAAPAAAAAADTAAAFAERIFPAADSLLAIPSATPAAEAADTLAEAVPFDPTLTVEQAFGAASELAAGETAVQPFLETLTDHPIFQGFVLLLAIAYMLMICAHLHDITGLLSRKNSDYMREGEGHSPGGGGSIQTAATVGLLMAAAVAVHLCETSPVKACGTMGVLLSILAALFGITLFQCGLLAFIGRLTLTRDLTRAIIHFKVLFFSLATILAMPPALLLVLCPPGEGDLWFYGTVLLAGIVLFLFLKESFTLFLAKKISILHWFLYLCIVECFPVSLVWLLATRC